MGTNEAASFLDDISFHSTLWLTLKEIIPLSLSNQAFRNLFFQNLLTFNQFRFSIKTIIIITYIILSTESFESYPHKTRFSIATFQGSKLSDGRYVMITKAHTTFEGK